MLKKVKSLLSKKKVEPLTSDIYKEMTKSFDNAYSQYIKDPKVLDTLNKEEKQNILFGACRFSDVEAIDNLIKVKVSINAETKYEECLLDFACQPNVIECLLKHGADIEHKNLDRWTPLMVMLDYERIECAKCLVENKANINLCIDGNTLFHLAAHSKNLSLNTFEYINSLKIDINAKNKAGYNALHLAIINNQNLNIIKYLVSLKIDVDAKTDSLKDAKTKTEIGGLTALHFAISKFDSNITSCLIESGANINAQSDGGDTPLHGAASNNHKEMCKLLLMKGASPHIENKMGLYPVAVVPTYKPDCKRYMERFT